MIEFVSCRQVKPWIDGPKQGVSLSPAQDIVMKTEDLLSTLDRVEAKRNTTIFDKSLD